MSLPQLIKKVPGATTAFRTLTGADKPGAWLFQPKTHRWLAQDELREQLPKIYQLLANYYLIQKRLPGPALGGRFAFSLANSLAHFQGITAIPLKVNDLKIYLNLDDPRMLQVPNELEEISGEGSFLRRYLQEGDTFLDIGSNHGSFSVAAASFLGPTGKIYAFEPQPQLNRLVQESLRANEAPDFQVFALACSDREGEAQFFVPRSSSGQAGLHFRFSAAAAHETITVRLTRLDDLISNHLITGQPFIKLDVEGNELAVLKGAKQFLTTYKPSIYIEINPRAMAAANTTTTQLFNLLTEIGFNGYSIPEDVQKKILPLENLKGDRHQNVILRFET